MLAMIVAYTESGMMARMHESQITLYGIRNCDTVKKERQYLTEHGVAHQFHDFKLHGVLPQQWDRWAQVLGWEALINRQGSTWRKLDEAVRASAVDANSAMSLLRAHPSAIRRPVVDWGDGDGPRFSVGFQAGAWAQRLLAARQGAAGTQGPVS